ncbi:30S ribosomal protein S11 [Candidatus Peribacteria bacterium]|nr:30S ribosomal protein S11 [Candidatus Peribacteria bacterium]
MAEVKKKRVKKQFQDGVVAVCAAYNNTIVTLSDPDGNVLGWASPGRMGFKGARQATPYAAQVSGENVAEQAQTYGMTSVKVVIKGPGPGREQAVRGLINGGLDISQIIDRTRLPHGGCRVRRQRKV